jgi:hypothetical protein
MGDDWKGEPRKLAFYTQYVPRHLAPAFDE